MTQIQDFPFTGNSNENHPKFTGKQLVMVDAHASRASLKSNLKKADLRLASSSDFADSNDHYFKAFEESDGIVFEKLGVAVINEERDDQVSMLVDSAPFLYSEPERYVYALDNLTEYFRGYKAAVDHLYGEFGTRKEEKAVLAAQAYIDDALASWGIRATNVLQSKYTGKGINVAVLDTGLSLRHDGFGSRKIICESFVPGQTIDDLNGHGTHCAGIASANTDKNGRRFGVASAANLFVGKVLDNSGSGTDKTILAGMEWALTNDCHVISMSLGGRTEEGEPYSQVYNDLAKRALENGTLIVAAAGNESRRDLGLKPAPVCHPANCPAIMAVAAIDQKLDVAYFSCCGTSTAGGNIDISGPGVGVYSSWKGNNYNTISGTSMATPYVAGIAALLWEKHPKATAAQIWMYITQNAKPLNLSQNDVGSGLVQAP